MIKRKTGRNGYGSSLFDTEDGTCYICGYQGDTARHEIIHGSRRKWSKMFGLWICVCPSCHTRIHAEDNGSYIWLKEEAQELFEREYHTSKEEFIEIFGVNYL